jgi:hypothetical protein
MELLELLKTQFFKLKKFTVIDKPITTNDVEALIRNGEWADLIELGRSLLSKNKDNPDLLETIAFALQQGAQLESASKFSKDALQNFPNSWTLNFIAGMTLRRLGHPKEGANYLLHALNLLPDNMQALREYIQATALFMGLNHSLEEYSRLSFKAGRNTKTFIAKLKTVRDWAEDLKIPLLEIGAIEDIPFKHPRIFSDNSVCDSDFVYSKSNKPYIACLENVQIFSNSSLILMSDGCVLSDTAGDKNFGFCISLEYEACVIAQKDGEVILDLASYETREIECGIFLSGLASNAFGHWLPEFLPKLAFYKNHPGFYRMPIIVDSEMPRSHFEHLSRLSTNELILINPAQTLKCKKLIVAPSPTFFPVEFFPHKFPEHYFQGLLPSAFNFLRTNISCDQKPAIRRIYLARKEVKWRRIINEDQIINGLKEYGFESVYMENLSAQEQIDLFQTSECFVGPNGSALLNFIFANSHAKFLILSQPNLHNWGTFQGVLDAMGYESICVIGDYARNQEQKHSDYHVRYDDVVKGLHFLGIEKKQNKNY